MSSEYYTLPSNQNQGYNQQPMFQGGLSGASSQQQSYQSYLPSSNYQQNQEVNQQYFENRESLNSGQNFDQFPSGGGYKGTQEQQAFPRYQSNQIYSGLPLSGESTRFGPSPPISGRESNTSSEFGQSRSDNYQNVGGQYAQNPFNVFGGSSNDLNRSIPYSRTSLTAQPGQTSSAGYENYRSQPSENNVGQVSGQFSSNNGTQPAIQSSPYYGTSTSYQLPQIVTYGSLPGQQNYGGYQSSVGMPIEFQHHIQEFISPPRVTKVTVYEHGVNIPLNEYFSGARGDLSGNLGQSFSNYRV